jgi:hypothetical protein
MELLVIFWLSVALAAVVAIGPCGVGRHKPTPYGILCVRCGQVVVAKRRKTK